MSRPTKLSWIGWTLVYLSWIKRDLFSRKPDTANARVKKAQTCLSKARRALLKSTRVANIEAAYDLVRGGGEENIEEIRFKPEHHSAFKAMMHVQLELLTDDRNRSDMMAAGLSMPERESFFRENLAQHLWNKGVGGKLAEAIAGYHFSKKPIQEFTPGKLEEILDRNTDQLAKVYGVDVSEGL